MIISLPSHVTGAISALEASGYEAYAVGGCIRDVCMGLTPHDYDIATSAQPNETKAVFSGFRVIETGIRHGTVTVIIDGETMEITTYRRDGEYKDNRHPQTVDFTGSLRDDLCRRDFTVNAMAYNPKKGLVDLFSGREHIKSRTIACVGDPCRRFEEDGLRILRALRFASVLGFDIEPATAAAISAHSHLLENISAERIYSELCRLLCGVGARRVLTGYRDVFYGLLPSLDDMSESEYERRCVAVERAPRSAAVRLALLLYSEDANRSRQNAARAASRLKADGRTARLVSFLSANAAAGAYDRLALRRILRREAADSCRVLIEMRHAAGITDIGGRAAEAGELEAIISRGDCVMVSQLKISGDDIRALGVERGPRVGRIMEHLLELVITDAIKNDRGALLDAAGHMAAQTQNQTEK